MKAAESDNQGKTNVATRRGTSSMSQSKQLVLCIFCNKRRPRAREDAIPHWMTDVLKPSGSISTDFITVVPGEPIRRRQAKFADLAALKLKDVCVDCNGRWMSQLENATKPLLEPMMLGRTRELDSAEERQVAAWAQLKCLSLDAYYRGDYRGLRHLPERLAHEFYGRRQPLENSLVTIGRYVPPRMGVMMPWGRHMLEYPTNAEGSPIATVTTTFAFGHLLVQVIIGA